MHDGDENPISLHPGFRKTHRSHGLYNIVVPRTHDNGRSNDAPLLQFLKRIQNTQQAAKK